MKPVIVSLAVLIIVGCSAAAGIMKGNPTDIVQGVASSGQNVMTLTQDLGKCDSLGTADVTFDEERTIGGTVALNWVQQNGGLMVDASPGTDGTVQDLKTLAVSDSPNNRLSKYLNVVGKNLAAKSTRPTLQWTFGVLDSPAVNAISAPGGYVFVTRGLLQRIDNEAALAGVLSHEIAHVTRKDAFLIYVKTKVDQCKTLAYAKAGQKEGMGALRSYGPGFIKTAIYAMDSFSGGPLDLNAAANNALLTLFSDEFVHRYLESGCARPGAELRRHRARADGGHRLQPAGVHRLRRRAARRSDVLRPPSAGTGAGGGDEDPPGEAGQRPVQPLRPGHLSAAPRPAPRRAGRRQVAGIPLARGPAARTHPSTARCQTLRLDGSARSGTLPARRSARWSTARLDGVSENSSRRCGGARARGTLRHPGAPPCICRGA